MRDLTNWGHDSISKTMTIMILNRGWIGGRREVIVSIDPGEGDTTRIDSGGAARDVESSAWESRKRKDKKDRRRGRHIRGRGSIEGGGLIEGDISRDTNPLNNQIIATIVIML